MSSDDDSSATENGITQAQVYDNLKRIGELEDEKKRIQEEIQNRTEQLREVIGILTVAASCTRCSNRL